MDRTLVLGKRTELITQRVAEFLEQTGHFQKGMRKWGLPDYATGLSFRWAFPGNLLSNRRSAPLKISNWPPKAGEASL